MNRTNGEKVLENAKRSHYNARTKCIIEPRPQASGFNSFLRWFKKNEQAQHRSVKKPTKHSTSAERINEKTKIKTRQYESSDTLNTISSLNLSLSQTQSDDSSSSCDSVFSTATTGFAFVKPNYYRPYGDGSVPEKLIAEGPVTDSYRRRVKQRENSRELDRKFDLTLRRKYRLFDTINSQIDAETKYLNNSENNLKYSEYSLPNVKNQTKIQVNESLGETSGLLNKKHRRTVSDSSKDKKAGAYVHVKGKRKAPAPPPLNLNLNTLSPPISPVTPTSTLGRKKRQAPQPPLSPGNEITGPIFTEGFLEDKEIRAVLESSSSKMFRPEEVKEETPSKRLTEQQKQSVMESVVKVQTPTLPTDTLKLEKGVLKSTKEDIVVLKPEVIKATAPPSPISPRPWYKRPLSGTRESNIPFKKEVILKTMDKRKNKTESQSETRSSIFDGRFGLFSRQEDSKKKDLQEKRRSGIGIPSISELDREAAEIVSKENASAQARLMEENEKYYQPPEQFKLKSQMFTGFNNTQQTPPATTTTDNLEQHKSTKDLISKFEQTSNIRRITVNTSFIGRTENFFDNKTKSAFKSDDDKDINKTSVTSASIFSEKKNILEKSRCSVDENVVITENKSPEVVMNVLSKKNLLGLWQCPFCTFENQNWRIICEICEKIKPYEKPVDILDLNAKLVEKVDEKIVKDENTKNEWEKKAEKVRKYFMPRQTGNTALSKSASETSVAKGKFLTKETSPSKLLGSPKLGFRNILNKSSQEKPDLIKTQLSYDETKNNKLESIDEKPAPLLDSSVVITTIVPVFQAPSAEESIELDNLNIDEIRNARIARFSANLDDELKIEEKEKTPPISNIEREKERLRDMIRQMNARALAERYPLVQSISLDESTTSSAPSIVGVIPKACLNNDSNKLGAIKKFFGKKTETEIESNEKLAAGYTKKSDLPTTVADLNEEKSNNIYENYPTNLNQLIDEKNIKLSEQEKAKVFEITEQLKSKKGLEDFRATLRTSPKRMSNTSTLAINKIMKNLETAIMEGQHEQAANLAQDLAKMKVTLSVTRQKIRPLSSVELDLKNIVVDMYVEDKSSHKGPIQVTVRPGMTLIELKQKIFENFDIPIPVQRWILNEKLASADDKTLLDYGVTDEKSVLYLYLVVEPEKVDAKPINKTPESPKPSTSHAQYFNEKEDRLSICDSEEDLSDYQNDIIKDDDVAGAIALPVASENIYGTLKVGWACPLCTLINSPNRPGCGACSEARPLDYVIPKQFRVPEDDFVIPDELKHFLENDKIPEPVKKVEKKNDLNKTNNNRKSSEIFNIIPTDNKPVKKREDEKIKPITTKIVMTAFTSASPNITRNKYRGVDNFNPNSYFIGSAAPKATQPVKTVETTKPTGVVKKEIKAEKKLAPKPPVVNKTQHYLDLLNLDNADAVPNLEPFECPICFMDYNTAEGVILRECLHTFCKECLINTVKYSEEAEIKCPFRDNFYSCDCVLQEREIKSLVTKEAYEQHLTISIRQAEHKIENAFHCKTPNCRGWCIYEDNVNLFKCPVCRITNCLTCQAIHDGLNCKQYQDRINSGCDTNMEAKRTKDMLLEMVEKGEAMNCPTCQVILMKKWGCDWLRCSMCKTEICWVTRGARWGPAGKGDTTAGCKCGIDGKKCHPKCNYCH